MSKMYKFLVLFAAAATLTACELDNYDGPNASIYGSFLDVKDGSLVQQDISRGTQIAYIEHGFADPETQYMLVQETGEYRNNLMFSGKYDFFFTESNFVIPAKLTGHTINTGENRLNFEVQPYIRISKVTISRSDSEIVAVFTVTPTVDNQVKTIGLFGHIDRVVGDAYALDRTTQNINAASKDTPTTYTLKLSTKNFKAGTAYYFRVGALINAAGAKHNYAPAVRITI